MAEDGFLKAIDIDPAHVDARLFLSILYANRGETSDTIQKKIKAGKFQYPRESVEKDQIWHFVYSYL